MAFTANDDFFARGGDVGTGSHIEGDRTDESQDDRTLGIQLRFCCSVNSARPTLFGSDEEVSCPRIDEQGLGVKWTIRGIERDRPDAFHVHGYKIGGLKLVNCGRRDLVYLNVRPVGIVVSNVSDVEVLKVRDWPRTHADVLIIDVHRARKVVNAQ